MNERTREREARDSRGKGFSCEICKHFLEFYKLLILSQLHVNKFILTMHTINLFISQCTKLTAKRCPMKETNDAIEAFNEVLNLRGAQRLSSSINQAAAFLI